MNRAKYSLCILISILSQSLMAMNVLSRKQDEIISRPEREILNREKIRQANPHLSVTQASPYIPPKKDLVIEREEMNRYKIQQANPYRDPMYQAASKALEGLDLIININKKIEEVVTAKGIIKQSPKLSNAEKQKELSVLREREKSLKILRANEYKELMSKNIFLMRPNAVVFMAGQEIKSFEIATRIKDAVLLY